MVPRSLLELLTIWSIIPAVCSSFWRSPADCVTKTVTTLCIRGGLAHLNDCSVCSYHQESRLTWNRVQTRLRERERPSNTTPVSNNTAHHGQRKPGQDSQNNHMTGYVTPPDQKLRMRIEHVENELGTKREDGVSLLQFMAPSGATVHLSVQVSSS